MVKFIVLAIALTGCARHQTAITPATTESVGYSTQELALINKFHEYQKDETPAKRRELIAYIQANFPGDDPLLPAEVYRGLSGISCPVGPAGDSGPAGDIAQGVPAR